MMEIKIPELSEGVMTATISMWHYSEGDSINKYDDLVEIVTDKATFNLPSPAGGRVKKILFNEGDAVKAGDVIAVID